MERRSSLVQQFIVVILAVCMNISLASGSAGFPQSADASAMSPDQLDKLLAPVALYPDALLMQVLAASVDEQEVLDGGNWLLQNKSLQDDQIDGAAGCRLWPCDDGFVPLSASGGHDVLGN